MLVVEAEVVELLGLAESVAGAGLADEVASDVEEEGMEDGEIDVLVEVGGGSGGGFLAAMKDDEGGDTDLKAWLAPPLEGCEDLATEESAMVATFLCVEELSKVIGVC
jgi:hypothetical protein